jgi:hypothetical protein
MMRRLSILLILFTLASPAFAPAQDRGRPRQPARKPPAQQSHSIEIAGYAMLGGFRFTARESFDAILGTSSGPIFGGGARVGLPFGRLFVDVGAWRFQHEGERVFVFNGQVFPLNIPTTIMVSPLEVSVGWRFRVHRMPKLFPYVAGGFTTLKYQETAEFNTSSEDVNENFGGYQLLGGAEYKITRWLGVAGEGTWTTVPDAIGENGVSTGFKETDLGGTSFRFKITIGR